MDKLTAFRNYKNGKKDEDGEDTLPSSEESVLERLKALRNDNTPANAASMASHQELLDTGTTTYRGNTYTLPDSGLVLPEIPERNENAGFLGKVKEVASDTWDRFKNTNVGGLLGSAASTANAFGTLADFGYQSGIQGKLLQRDLVRSEKSLEAAERQLARAKENGASDARIDRLQRRVNYYQGDRDLTQQFIDEDVNRKAVEAVQAKADELQGRSQQRIEAAKEGRGGFGRLLVDAGASTAQMAADVAVGALTGGGTMLPLGIRAFGGAAQEARQSGATLGQQIAYAAPSVAIEILTEKMSNIAAPYKTAYGAGKIGVEDKVDEIISAAVKKFAKGGIGEKLLGGTLKASASFAFEGMEEFVGDWLSWQLPRIYDGDVNSFSDQLAESLRDFASGGLAGLFGAAADVGTYTYNADQEIARMTQERAEAAEYRNNITLGQNLKAAGITNDQVKGIVSNAWEETQDNPVTSAYFDSIYQRIAQGEDLSKMGDAELGALYSLYTAATGGRISEEEYQDRVQKIVDSRELEQLGYTGEEILDKQAEPAEIPAEAPTTAPAEPAPEMAPIIPVEITPQETQESQAAEEETPIPAEPIPAEQAPILEVTPSLPNDLEAAPPVLTETIENDTLTERPAAQLPEPYRSENGYTVTATGENTAEVKFDTKPSEEVRNALKQAGFRWSKKNGSWTGKTSFDTIRGILDQVYRPSEAPVITAEESTVEAPDVEATAQADNSTSASPIYQTLMNAESFELDGYSYSIRQSRFGWTANVRNVNKGFNWNSPYFQTREEAAASAAQMADGRAANAETPQAEPALELPTEESPNQAATGMLSEDEQYAVKTYKGSYSYKINAMLRAIESGEIDEDSLSDYDRTFLKNMDSAIEALPVYNGTAYRNLLFDNFGGEEAFNKFLSEHTVNEPVFYPAYTSSSSVPDGHPVDGKYVVNIVIEGANGRILEGFGNNMEQEVLFPRGTAFWVSSVEYSNGTPTIKMKEVQHEEGGTGRGAGGNRGTELGEPDRVHQADLRQVQAPDSGVGEVQSIPERNPESNSGEQSGSYETVSGRQRDSVREEGLTLPTAEEAETSSTEEALALPTEDTPHQETAKEEAPKAAEPRVNAEAQETKRISEAEQKRYDKAKKALNRAPQLIREAEQTMAENRWAAEKLTAAQKANFDAILSAQRETSSKAWIRDQLDAYTSEEFRKLRSEADKALFVLTHDAARNGQTVTKLGLSHDLVSKACDARLKDAVVIELPDGRMILAGMDQPAFAGAPLARYRSGIVDSNGNAVVKGGGTWIIRPSGFSGKLSDADVMSIPGAAEAAARFDSEVADDVKFFRQMAGYVDPSMAEQALDAYNEASEDAENFRQQVQEAQKIVDAFEQRKPHEVLSDELLKKLKVGEKITREDLQELAADAYGGSRGTGAFDMKTAYDALELAVNRYLMTSDFVKDGNGNAASARMTEKRMQKLLELLPTQNIRTEEQIQYQQFSTPPNIAYLAAWAANIGKGDTILEPSAGIGGLALWGKAWGATVYGNELSERRSEILRSLGLDEVFTENAEQINNILPDYVSPSVVLMNPPFSSTAGRTSTNNTANAKRHVEQALERLQDGGRLVAILGRGMANDSKTFAPWWDELRKDYTIRANLSVNGENYKKYGTDFDVQLVVIDKTGPQADRSTTITGQVDDLMTVPDMLEGVRNDRQRIEADNNQPVRRGLQSGDQPRSDSVEGERGTGRSGERSESGSPAPSTGTGMERSGNGGRGNQQSGVREDGQGTGYGDRGELRGEIGRDAGSDSAERGTERNDRPVSELTLGGLNEEESAPAVPKEDNGVYAEYVPPKTGIQGAKKHPAKLVESAAMASVPSPKVNYTPNLPQELVSGGKLSDVQLTNIVYAGAAHSQMIPEQNKRKGYFIGDGTGVGKGRQIAGIILDNMRQGREKAVWISNSNNLFTDAQRDWTDIGGNKDQVFSLSKTKVDAAVKAPKGIAFTTYSTLASKSKKTKQTRVDQLVEWLGKDFDGVIAFDEAHNLGNLLGKRGKFGKSSPSQKAISGAELQEKLPNARVVYVSATMATDVDGMAFAERLGLWGPGTQFSNVRDFVEKISAGGLAAMELVARDMKAMGVYQARSISFDGVQYDTLTHNLTDTQTEIYDTMSRAWQVTLQNMNEALKMTGADKNGRAKAAAKSAYYGAVQRFYNQVITSMSMPSVVQDIRKQLDNGKSVVIQIVNTNEAAMERGITEMEAEGGSPEDLDITPREQLIGYLMNAFPVQEYETYTDDNGNLQSRPVTDSQGNPVLDKKAVAKRDQLVEQIQNMSVPQGPLDLLLDAFGPENVAEVTGRKRRVVPGRDQAGNLTTVIEKRGDKSNEADVQAFQDGKKRILVFSDAGGTGKSYHSDLRAKNQQQRVHYLLQPGWNAPKAVQGLGRTNRSNQANAPTYVLVTTNASGQKRFVSTIARRLDQLGAITKGQRQTGSGVFSAKDNLESDLARDSLVEFYRSLIAGRIEGLDAKDIIESLGLSESIMGKDGRGGLNMTVASDMSTFLNRILALEVNKQNAVFDAFNDIFEREYRKALDDGTLDMGMETVRADKVEVIDEIPVYKDPETGAETKYVQAKVSHKTNPAKTVDALKSRAKNFIGLYRKEDGTVIGVFGAADKTDERGNVTKQVKVLGPVSSGLWQQKTLDKQAKLIPESEWDSAWAEEVKKAPKYREETKHMLTGTLLPVWNKLPASGNVKVQRLIADDGRQYLGRIIDPSNIDGVLKSLGASKGRTKKTYSPADVLSAVYESGGKAILENDRMALIRRVVGGERRIEITGDNLWAIRSRIPEIYSEYIQSKHRYFIPNGKQQLPVLERLLGMNPVREVEEARAASVQESKDPAKKKLTAEDKTYLDAVNAGDMEAVRTMVEAAARRSGFNDAIPEQTLTYSIRTGAPPKKTVKVYKVFTMSPDGAPTALFVSGTEKLPQGVWLNAQDTWHFTAKNGLRYVPSTQNPYTQGGKTGGMVEIPNDDVRAELISRGFLPEGSKAKSVVALAYRPGWHAGDLPFFPQGGTKREGSNYPNIHRYNQVVFECELDADRDYTEYAQSQPKAISKRTGKVIPRNADLQEMPEGGYYRYSTNPLTQGGKNGEWYISGSLKINRALTQQECDDILSEYGRLPQEWEQGEMNLASLGYTGPQNDAARKTLAPITYDDNGNIIPLSQRFNPANPDVRYSRESGLSAHPENWETERIGPDKKPLSTPDIINKIRTKYKVPVSTGGIRIAGTRAQYDQKQQTIRSRITGSLPDISHELGHHLDATHDLSANLDDDVKNELLAGLDADFAAQYSKNELPGEAVAEFTRKYLQNRETARIDYPLFYEFFRNSMSDEEITTVDELADDINAYYSLSESTGNYPIHLAEEKAKDFRTTGEKLTGLHDRFRQQWIDSNQAIKKYTEKVGGNAYLMATNAGYAANRAYEVVTGELRDMHGKRVGPGLQKALEGVNTRNKEEYKAFGMYLVCRHGPERLAEGLRVFADDRMNSTEYMDRTKEMLEEKYPQFEEAAERLDEFQQQLLDTYGVETGLYSADTVKEWRERWKYYVPFNRWFGGEEAAGEPIGSKMNQGQNQGFANQKGPYKQARGSGRDFKHPVDNIIDNAVRLVNASIKNNVMQEITRAASVYGGAGQWIERVNAPVKKKTYDARQLKKNVVGALTDSLPDGGTLADEIQDTIDSTIDDLLIQYGKGYAQGSTITVRVNGQDQFWQVHDKSLFESITNMSANEVGGFVELMGRINSRITQNITGNNLIWSITSNAPRDFMTVLTTGKTHNAVKLIGKMAKSYVNAFKSINDSSDELHREYIAMGGGDTAAFTSNRSLARSVREKITAHKTRVWNPIEVGKAVLKIGDTIGNVVELGPREATYRICRENGMTPEEAFYAAMESTTNFHRSGVKMKTVNKLVPFSNAAIQGMDKMIRWLNCEDIPKEKRTKARVWRTAGYLASNLAAAAAIIAVNSLDKKRKKDYENLSTYTKNNFFCIPIPDSNGKFVTIPKPREIAIPETFFERILELYLNENENAFYEFSEYLTDTTLPGGLSGLAQAAVSFAQGDPASGLTDIGSALGDLGIFGTATAIVANKDFLGRPIIPEAYENTKPREQYNQSTSGLAYTIGQALGISPFIVDYLGNDLVSFVWKPMKAIWTTGKEPDWSLGVKSQWVRDSLYSTDLVNRLYDAKDAAEADKKSVDGTVNDLIRYKWLEASAGFYTNYNKVAKTEPETEQGRKSRAAVLEAADAVLSNVSTEGKRYVEQAVRREYGQTDGDVNLFPTVMDTEVKALAKDGKPVTYKLTGDEYVQFQTRYNTLYYRWIGDAISKNNGDAEDRTLIIKQAKKYAAIVAKGEYAEKRGGYTKEYNTWKELSDAGLPDEDIIRYYAAADRINDDGYKKYEAAEAIYNLELPDVDMEAALMDRAFDGMGTKYKAANEYGVDAGEFGLVLGGWEDTKDEWKASGTDGGSGWTQRAAAAAIDRIYGPTTDKNRSEKAAVWQSLDARWKSSNNPYSSSVGGSVYEALNLPTE